MDTRRDDVPDWDSFAYVNFIVGGRDRVRRQLRRGRSRIVRQRRGDRPAHPGPPAAVLTAARFRATAQRCSSIPTSSFSPSCPLTLAGFFLLGHASRAWALRWIIVASLFFYAWWRPLNVCIIAPSDPHQLPAGADPPAAGRAGTDEAAPAAVLVARHRLQHRLPRVLQVRRTSPPRRSTTCSGPDLRDGPDHPAARHLVHHVPEDRLPRSTFTPSGSTSFTLQDYLPVRAVLSAAHRRADRALPRDDAAVPSRHRAGSTRRTVASGITLFVFGLFKKVVLADGIAPYVSADLPAGGRGPARVFPAGVDGRDRLHACRSTSTFPATPTWPSGWRGCSASGCRRTSTRR